MTHLDSPAGDDVCRISRRQLIVGAAATGAIWSLSGAELAAAGRAAAPPATHDAHVLTEWVRVVYERVAVERLSPPAAARAYAHVALAAYEAVVDGMPWNRSLGGQLHDLPELHSPVGVHWPIAVNEAVGVAARAVLAQPVSLDVVAAHAAATTEALAGGVPTALVRRSVAQGRAVGEAIAARTRRDQFAETRGLPYDPPIGPDKWVRTPPNFGAAIEPYWGRIHSFTLVTNDECKPVPPVPYSEQPGSAFWEQAMVVHETSQTLDDALRQTALFWRDNPDGSTGLPSGHWMLTACAVIDQERLDLGRAAEVLALTGLALADGFTSCWTEKYETNLLRPVTYIRRHIDPDWSSFVNSPAFPEYTSGHSVGSGAAAHVLTTLLGDVAYVDDVGLRNGYPARRFSSFWEAAWEAANSRLLGGIHYPMAIEVGVDQGVAVADKVLTRARTRHRPRRR